ncbi:MAG: hypothetical protein WC529_08870 [Candidatus Margulisiibacteriota bacterium]
MKKLIFSLLMCLLLVGASFGLKVDSNWASTSWNLTFEGSSLSDYVSTPGCQYALLTVGDSSVGTITAEAVWYLAPGSTVSIGTDALVAGTPLQVKSPRAKFKLYESGAGYATAEAIVYCY